MKIYLYELPDKLNNLTQYKLPVHLLKPFDNLIYCSEVTGVNSCQFEVFSLPSLFAPPLSSLDLGHFSTLLTGIRQAHTHLVSFNGKSFSLNLRLNWFLSLLTTFCLSNDFACVSAIWWVMRMPRSVSLRVCMPVSVCSKYAKVIYEVCCTSASERVWSLLKFSPNWKSKVLVTNCVKPFAMRVKHKASFKLPNWL